MPAAMMQILSSENPPRGLTARDVGGKAHNLLKLLSRGFPVPEFWMVPCAAFEALFASHREDINAIVNGIDFEDPNEIEAAAGCVRDLLLERKVLERIDEAVRDLRQREDGETLFAVRSSVLDEDSTHHSFAGLMDTCLNVRPEDLARSILSVWASAWNARALAYRHTMGVATTDISAAVIVQRMVASRAGGVMFTHEPETGAESTVINAAFGLADDVTAGTVCADTYRIAHGSRDVQIQVTDKAGSDVVSALTDRGLRNGYNPKHEHGARVLSDEHVLQLRDLGLSVYAEFGAPEDIEWALDADHKFWLFQTRPITPAKRAATVRIWDNSNIVESYEGLTLPLTFSFVRKAYKATFCGAARRFLPLRWRHLERLQVFDQLLGLVDGRVYYNLTSWYVMLAHIPGFPKNRASWERMVGVQIAVQVPDVRLGVLDAFCAAAHLAWRLATARGSAARFFATFNTYYRRYSGLDLASADAERLAVIYRDAFSKISETWHVTVENDLITMIYVELSHRLLTWWAPGADEAIRQRILRSNGGIESVAPIKSLHRLIEGFAAEARLTDLLATQSDREVLERIRMDPDLSRLSSLIDHHIAKYGDRGPAELKLETPTFREQPERLIALIRMGLKNDRPRPQESHKTVDLDPTSSLRPYVSNPFKRALLHLVLRGARRAIANRENMRFARSRLFGVARRIFLRMGACFVREGLLDEDADIFHLTVDEVLDTISGTAVTRDLRGIVKLRRNDYSQFALRQPAPRFSTFGIPHMDVQYAATERRQTMTSTRGLGCAPGRAKGRAKIVEDPNDVDVTSDDIVIARSTDPGWVFLLSRAAGLVVEKGSLLSHTAIIARELGVPTVVGVADATTLIPDGARIDMDGNRGTVQWH